ncbi:sensor histidine kinase [Desulfofundulus thermosubterraneus]|uniref:Histidine kinase-, DNA gyrase B-, and HSP90-like ATPase n=1 Tax=Desulfofundulus thermosubterraneus DSM 16057 TaxID=1121432 RepID=A0A1M6BRQ4_9FIRM|nr:PocR ligand-binding domain-containing protein [Desulfofundulus thermosubterraneus]SHI51470.1 Histidine kinase-, DNA gyrase B-, and HSP90-like ATPase [Desulfofundulus thermosubterraneus DSM 16057]
MKLSPENLSQLIEKDKFLKIIESFTRATDITIDINDVYGNPVVEHDFFYGFCATIRSTAEGLKRCIRSNAEVGFRTAATGEVCFGTCHAGGTLMAVPLVVEGQFWGSITCGQMHLSPPDKKAVENMLKATADLGLDEQELVRGFQEIQVITPQKCQAASQLIQYVTNYIAELIYRAKIQEKEAREQLRTMDEARVRAELEKSLRLAELKNLQAQIKPHFLFNTLNTITSLVSLNENQKALKTLYALSNLLRCYIHHPEELVSLREELKYVQSYLTIQQTRFGNRLNVTINVPAALQELPVPFLSLQPLVENACIHGLEPKEGSGHLIITGEIKDGICEISVTDDGVGIPREVLDAINGNSQAGAGKPRGIGLKNVDERLKLYYGPQYGVSLDSHPGWTRVCLKLPAGHIL